MVHSSGQRTMLVILANRLAILSGFRPMIAQCARFPGKGRYSQRWSRSSQLRLLNRPIATGFDQRAIDSAAAESKAQSTDISSVPLVFENAPEEIRLRLVSM